MIQHFNKVHSHTFTGSALITHDHDILLTGGQAAGEALQQLAGVIGKTATGHVTDTTSVRPITGGTPEGVLSSDRG